jgi:hypothetical protein
MGGWQSTQALGKILRPYLKNNLKAKKAGDVAQVTECLLSKHKALNSNASTKIDT